MPVYAWAKVGELARADTLRNVFPESDVARHLIGSLVELSRQVQQCEVVLLFAAIPLLVLCVRLFEIAIL